LGKRDLVPSEALAPTIAGTGRKITNPKKL